MSRSYVLKSMIVMMFSPSCKSRNDLSSTKHDIGVVTRDIEGITSCQQRFIRGKHPDADKYLVKLLGHIAKGNPDTFKGALSPASICLETVEKSGLNAFALPGKNKIEFNSSLLKAAGSDAEVAAVMAHELAHLSMQSKHTEGDVPPAVLKHPQWIEVRKKFDIKHRALTDKRKVIQDNSDQVLAKKRAILDDCTTRASDKLKNEVAVLRVMRFVPFKPLENAPGDALELSKHWNEIAGARLLMCTDVDDRVALDKLGRGSPRISLEQARIKAADYMLRVEKVRDQVQEIIGSDKAREMDEMEATLATLNSQKLALDPFFKQVRDDFDRFITDVAGPGAKFNWTEQEADEVGYELYLRAGFKSEYYTWLDRRLLPSAELETCLNENIAKKVAPLRGEKSHPSACWRIYNIEVLEEELHKDTYVPLKDKAFTKELFPGELDDIKKLMP